MVASTGQADYARGIRAAVRGLWLSVISEDQFIASMSLSIERGLTRAYHEGAESCGIEPDELTGDELSELQQIIFEQMMWIGGFASSVAGNRKADKKPLGPHLRRAASWIGRYSQTRDIAKMRACEDKKYMWVRGPTSDGCRDCIAYDGTVHRGSVWAKYAKPGDASLACHGFGCLCSLQPTDARGTPGRPPAMTG